MKTKITGFAVPIALSLITYLVSGYFDVFEKFVEFSQAHEQYQLDEIITVLAVLNIYLIIRLFTGWRVLIKKNEDISSTLVDKNLQFRESQHRQKNNINLLLGLLDLEKDRFNTPESRDVHAKLVSRINSMGILYEQLDSKENKLSVDAGDYFGQFFTRLAKLYYSENITVEFDVPHFELNQQIISPLSIMINELYTNSVKYAFPEDRTGLITFKLKKNGGSIEAVYADNGVGFDPDSVKNGFGHQLFNMLAKQMHAEIDIKGKPGIQYCIRFEVF